MTLTRCPLHDGWTLHAPAGPVRAAAAGAGIAVPVPGCVHTDLLAAGLIPDPFLDDNEALLDWIGLVDGTYRTTLEWVPDAASRTDLAFASLYAPEDAACNGDFCPCGTPAGACLGETYPIMSGGELR